jgi:hypothetical protein
MVLIIGVSFAQQDTLTVKQKQKQEKKAEKIAIKLKKIEDGKFLFSPIIAPGYTPELQFAIGGGGIMSWRNSKTDATLPRSNMPINMTISSTGAFVINLKPTTFWAGDKLRFSGDVWLKLMPDNYWGIGYQNAYEKQKSDSLTAYNRTWFQFRGDVIYRTVSDLFAGLTFDVNYTQGSDASEGVAADPNYIVYNDRPFNVGFGPTLQFDSRDLPVNAWKGMFISVSAVFSGPYFGGDNEYQVYRIDYRQYVGVSNKDGRVIAWQFATRLSFGDVPYGEMSQLGNPWDLRGYTWGRYRDKSLYFSLVEYRHKLYKKDGKPTKSSFVFWMGSGKVFDVQKGSDWNDQSMWLPNYGVGYRFELQPRLHLRIDFGIGRETTGFYFNMNEAF